MRRAALAATAILALLGAGPTAIAASVTEAVFDANLLSPVKNPSNFHYRYELKGKTIPEPYIGQATMQVREVAANGEKQVFFDLFEGEARREFGPIAATEQNPLLLVFLQLDVNEMANLTGGMAGYFQQQIRKAFNDQAEDEPLEVEVGGQKVQARRLRMRPYRNDPQIERFPAFKDKVYEFVVASGVPGGLVRIAATTPDPVTGELFLEKSMTFVAVGP